MNLEDLRAVQSDERRADSLQSLPEDFYRNVADYIEELRAQRERAAERAADPFGSDEVRQLTDEIETAEEVAEAIYERRVGKVVKRASLAAAGMPADEEGLTAEERELFSDLVSQIESHRSNVLAAFAGEGEMASSGVDEATPSAEASPEADVTPSGTSGASDGREATPETHESGGDRPGRADPTPKERPHQEAAASAVREHAPDVVGDANDGDAGSRASGDVVGDSDGDGEAGFDASDAMGDGSRDPKREPMPTQTDGGAVTAGAKTDETEADSATGPDHDRTTVRVTREVGEIFGVDERTYHLGEEDIVTLPEENAEPLIERDAAQRIE